ncbi:MAG: 4-hydroxy-tetrahydrodipicolinate reductase [Planctomycetota bacterium]
MTRVLLAGASGHMGRVIMPALRAAGDVEIAGTLVRGSDAPAVLGLAKPDVLLDFTCAEASRELGLLAAERGISPVIGTSGLAAADVQSLRTACLRAKVGGLLVPNFSIGAMLQMRAAEAAARHLPPVVVRERHHPDKRDAPSGTARATAARIDGITSGSVPIESERREGLVAEQDVLFEQPGERLELRHVVTDRRAYLPGILLAVRSVRGLVGLHVGLDALID